MDLVLLQRFREGGDEDAFGQIVQRHAGMVYAVCYRILGNRAHAEDVVQETFFRLIKTKNPVRVTRSLGGWLHRVATRLSIDTLRSEASRRQREVTVGARAGLRPTTSWKEISPHIDACLDELPEATRTLLVDHFLQGRSQSELAAERAVSPATICRHMKAGLQKLREKLERRDVVIASTLLPVLLTRTAQEALPAALTNELGKMAMVSGGRSSATSSAVASSTGVMGPVMKLIVVAGLMAAALVAIYALADFDFQFKTTYEPESPVREANSPR